MRRITTVILVLIILSGCYGGFRYWREKLDIDRVDQTANLKVLGQNVDKTWVDTVHKMAFYFYRNGVLVRDGYSDTIAELKEEPKVWAYCDAPFYSGAFKIEKDSIIIEGWVSSSGFDQYPVYKLSGKILNMSKIELTSHYNKNVIGSEVSKTYILNPYDIKEMKPDSCMRWFE